MELLNEIGTKAKASSYILQKLKSQEKNQILETVAKALISNQEELLKANELDLNIAIQKGIKESLIDRLRLTEERIEAMADGLIQLMALEDPIGQIVEAKIRPNGLEIGQKRVPLGVVGIIYESRPNVTVDAFGLCFKASNAVVLKGGSDAIHSNKKIVEIIQNTLEGMGYQKEFIQLIEDTSRETTLALMKLNKYIDVLIPRGGFGLIRSVIENSTIPVIETGTGNCHAYIDESADLEMAKNIVINAKTQRIGVCNACESLVIHDQFAKRHFKEIVEALKEHQVEVRGDERAFAYDNSIKKATTEDFAAEYLDLIISVKIVDSLDEAINHINNYNTKHSEVIITSDYHNSRRFLDEVDAAAVYVNASTRFTDGFEFGFGAEIGISTQKLHARGPMGLKELTTTKYVIYGQGQIR